MQWKQIKICFLGIILIGIGQRTCLLFFGIGYEYGISSIKNQAQQSIPTIEEKKQDKGIFCKAYKWQETIENKTLDAEYDFFANVVNTFADNGIQLLLNQGSLLGARRHFSFIPWDIQDVDFSVFSTDTDAIEKVLNNELQLRANRNNDGAGPGNTGFGYHVFTPYQRFIDLWLFGTINSTHSGCVGVENGCQRWYTKYKWKDGEPPYFLTSDLACRHIPFGPYMFPSPYNTYKILNKQFPRKSSKTETCLNGILSGDGNACCSKSCGQCGGSGCSSLPGGESECCVGIIRDMGIYCEDEYDTACIPMAPTARPDWETSCLNHKTREEWDCGSRNHPFVHRNKTIHTMKRGKTAIVSFRVENGTYSLLE